MNNVTTLSKRRKQRHALSNYAEVRRALRELIELCKKKKGRGGGRLNAKTTRKKLANIRNMIKEGSYD